MAVVGTSDERSRKEPVRDVLKRLAAEEQAFLGREFLAPALRGGRVRVRIAGAVCTIRTRPKEFEGWGVFQPASFSEARLVRRASLAERRRYLELFCMVRLIICRRRGDRWLGCAAHAGDRRIRLEGLAPVALAEEVQPFDVVQARYDGTQFWFDALDPRHDPARAAYLRSALGELVPPAGLSRPGLTAEERAAYELNYWQQVQPEPEQAPVQAPGRNPAHRRRSSRQLPAAARPDALDPVGHRLRESLSHAGAQLIDYLERGDSYRVTYSVAGQRFTSAVAKGDLTVQSAGICLEGMDRNFDLTSLVGVLREGQAGGGIYLIDE